jgi:uncharacterized membrane protein YdjX (TVP38/TMEM64 family)
MMRRVPLARLAVVVLLAACAGWALTHRDMLDLYTIGPALSTLGIWAPIGFILIYATATVLCFSGALLSLTGGALFGPVWGTAWNLIGATLGAAHLHAARRCRLYLARLCWPQGRSG